MTNSLLAGLRVLDLTRLLPGPFCTLYLAQMGAEVIKVEEPNGGDYARTLSPEMFSSVNRGKRSVTLDLRTPDGVTAFLALTQEADVVIESFRPGVMDRLGCGYAVVRQKNPKIVFAALTGYGQSGPLRDAAGHDLNYCGYAGVVDQTGAAGAPPAMCGTQIADLAGGALTCTLAILAAIIGAKNSGTGCFVDAAMLDGTLALQAVTLGTIRALGKAPSRGSDMLTGGLPNYAIYECADGGFVAMGALEQKFWVNFCAAAGVPDWGRRVPSPGPSGDAVRKALTALFKTRTRDEWDALLAGKDTCVSAILTPDEALRGPQVRARGLVTYGTNGKPEVGFPVQFDGAVKVSLAPAPALGADNDSVLKKSNA